MLRNQHGITLVALVVTIVVLIILAAVTISVTVSGGILNRAENAAEDYRIADNKWYEMEANLLAWLDENYPEETTENTEPAENTEEPTT